MTGKYNYFIRYIGEKEWTQIPKSKYDKCMLMKKLLTQCFNVEFKKELNPKYEPKKKNEEV